MLRCRRIAWNLSELHGFFGRSTTLRLDDAFSCEGREKQELTRRLIKMTPSHRWNDFSDRNACRVPGGLAVVHALARQHGGNVKVASAGVGKGTVLALRLPLAASLPSLPPTSSRHPRSRVGASVEARQRRALDHDELRRKDRSCPASIRRCLGSLDRTRNRKVRIRRRCPWVEKGPETQAAGRKMLLWHHRAVYHDGLRPGFCTDRSGQDTVLERSDRAVRNPRRLANSLESTNQETR